jgi:hypothetical protein
MFSMWLLSGCVVTPIEAQNGGTPVASTATIAVAPVSGAPGDTVFVSGAGWASNESVYVNLEQTPDQEPIQTTVAIATTDGDGRFTATFVYPVDPIWREPGKIDVVAYSVKSNARATAAFEVLESPAPTAQTPTATPVTVTPVAATATATPVPTGQPTATRTPAPVPQSGDIGTVVSSALNVRSGPSTAFPILRSIGHGTEFTVLGQNNSGAWLFVRLYDGTEGWLARAYTNYTGIAPIVSSPKPPSPTPYPTSTRPPQGTGWRGEYYNNPHLTGDPQLVRDDAEINFDWGYGSPAYGIDNDYFAVRWVRSFFLSAGTYRFYATADDGVRVWVNGDEIINEWHPASNQTFSAIKQVDTGSALVRVEFYEATQLAKVHFWWEPVEQQSYPDWRGEYYSNKDLSGSPAFVRNDSGIDFDWGTGSPANNFPSDNFSVRWTRSAYFNAGNYRFHATMDDGMRVYLDDSLLIDEWRNGSSREITRDIYVGEGTHRLRVEYFEDGNWAIAKLWWERLGDQPNNFPDWKGEYWDNRSLDGDPRVVRNDGDVDFNWGSGSPDSRIPSDNFSARWTRTIDFDNARYRFYAKADDGVRVWVGDSRVIDEWHDNSSNTTYSGEINLDGDNERVKVEYYERTGGARVEVWWEKVGSSPTATPTNIHPYADVVPAQGPTGIEVTVSGGGFPANATVNLYLSGLVQASAEQATSAQVRATTTTNNNGNYSMKFTIPNTWPDGSPVEVGKLALLVATQDFGVEATAVFEVTSPPVSGGNPYAQVSPSSGGADTRVTVRGGGFPANTRVRAYLAGLATASALNSDDMESYASTTTDGAGNYSLSFDMPDEWPDGDDIETGKIIILVATDDFGVEASADFDFFTDDETPNASIDISPSSGGAGTSIRVSGDGFPANSEVNLYLGSLDSQVGGNAGDRIYASTNTDRRGNYSMAFTMPSQWPDGSSIPSGRVAIVVANSDFSIVAGGSFNFTASGTPAPTPTATNTVVSPTATPAPAVNINPGSGGAGTTVTLSGNGFPANVTVNAYLAQFGKNGGFASDAPSYGTTTTDGAGNYSFSMVMPEEWPNGDNIDDGRLLIVVATNDFSRQASATFNYNAVSSSVIDQAAATPTPTVEATAVPATPEPVATEVVTEEATEVPTRGPRATDKPTKVPANTPEATATEVPTEIPTEVPTELPTNTPEPTAVPTEAATNTPEPTVASTEIPTDTPEPTLAPTDVPTDAPEPTLAPTDVPTEVVPNTPEPTATTVVEEPTAAQQQEPVKESPTATPTLAPTSTLVVTPTVTLTAPPVEEPTTGSGS